RLLRELSDEARTMVFFESPHRLAAALTDMAEAWGGQRRAAVCRELSKTHEEVRRGPLGQLVEWAAAGVRGEITIVVAGALPRTPVLADHVGEVLSLAEGGMRMKDAAADVAARTGLGKRDLYEAALAARRGNAGD
ncbi:MAG TPA: SAM-dependent methyltransferase, partial [Actinomycetaceae bacterium]|nr:SAM-dependent methyltransferase [Actinomycetaceae bacterium]